MKYGIAMTKKLQKHSWQCNLGRDVAVKIREDLAAGKLPWISYDAEELGGRLVREYADGHREFVDFINDKATLTPAPQRG